MFRVFFKLSISVLFLFSIQSQAQGSRVASTTLIRAMETQTGQAILARILGTELSAVQQLTSLERSVAFDERILPLVETGLSVSGNVDSVLRSFVKNEVEFDLMKSILSDARYKKYTTPTSARSVLIGSSRASNIDDWGIASGEYANLKFVMDRLQKLFPTTDVKYYMEGDEYQKMMAELRAVFINPHDNTSRFRPVQWMVATKNLAYGIRTNAGAGLQLINRDSFVPGDIIMGLRKDKLGERAFLGVYKRWSVPRTYNSNRFIVEIDGVDVTLDLGDLRYVHVYDTTQSFSAESYMAFWEVESFKHSVASGKLGGESSPLWSWAELAASKKAGEGQSDNAFTSLELASSINDLIQENGGQPVLMAFVSEVRGNINSSSPNSFTTYYTAGYKVDIQFVSQAEIRNLERQGAFNVTYHYPQAQNVLGVKWLALPPAEVYFFTNYARALQVSNAAVRVHRVFYLPTVNSIETFNLTSGGN